jgi:hypothetical protein
MHCREGRHTLIGGEAAHAAKLSPDISTTETVIQLFLLLVRAVVAKQFLLLL